MGTWMTKRKSISPSVRWSVFARDGFTCRYCGRQAGEDGIDLVVDHVLSLKDGGDDRMDNLATACKTCNGGKGAKSLQNAPSTDEILSRIQARSEVLRKQAEAMQAAIDNQAAVEQQIVNMKCQAYGNAKSILMASNEKALISSYMRTFGADQIMEWYSLCFARDVLPERAIKYICGIVRKLREEEDEDGQ